MPLLIFDCDGVLVDSELLANAALAKLISDLGHPMTTEEAIKVFTGLQLKDVLALAEQLPPGRFAVNLCEDRYQFLRAFCAVALAGQTNLLPASRAPQAIADVLRGHPAAYAIVDDPARVEQAHCFELPRATASAAAAPPRIPLIARLLHKRLGLSVARSDRDAQAALVSVRPSATSAGSRPSLTDSGTLAFSSRPVTLRIWSVSRVW